MRVLNVAIALATLIAVSLPGGAAAESGRAAALLDLHEAGGSYLLQRDALLADESLDGEALATLTTHGDWRVRHSVELLQGLRARPGLYAEIALAEPSFDRAGRPIFDLRAMRDPAARAFVVERFLHGGDVDSVRGALALSLVGLGTHWDRLQHHLLAGEEAVEVRLILVSSMRRAGAAAARAGLALGLADDAALVRAEAARSVGWRTDGELWADELLAALHDEALNVRAMAARALGWRQVEAAFGPLLIGLVDPAADVRLHTLRALSRIDREAACGLPALAELRRDPDPRVSGLAARLAAQ